MTREIQDDLTPDVRTTSERRQKTLEQELVKAEQSALEQKMVTKYRGVKFFGTFFILCRFLPAHKCRPDHSSLAERQKLLRKIKQAKKALESSPEDQAQKSALLEARVDLYYVLVSRRSPSLAPLGVELTPSCPLTRSRFHSSPALP